jgi:hypothetical protein
MNIAGLLPTNCVNRRNVAPFAIDRRCALPQLGGSHRSFFSTPVLAFTVCRCSRAVDMHGAAYAGGHYYVYYAGFAAATAVVP